MIDCSSSVLTEDFALACQSLIKLPKREVKKGQSGYQV